MKISRVFVFALFITIFIFPFALNSADIYEELNGNAKIITGLNNHIILDDINLKSTFIIIKSDKNYTNFQIQSSCQNKQKIVYKDINSDKFNIFLIKVDFIQNFCNNKDIFLANNGQIYTDTKNVISIYTKGEILNDLLDYDTALIKEKIQIYKKEIFIDKDEIKNTTKDSTLQKIKLINKAYELAYKRYELNLLESILDQRENIKYTIPISGKTLPTKGSGIPNANRPFRAQYTDGIHHGWDIRTPENTPIKAIGNGIIIRVKNDFVWNDFNKIQYKDLTDLVKATNLDILRGNQVWLKTMDGNIIVYAHLSSTTENLYEGEIVNKGDILGFVGKSGVPDKEYNDYHLHFEIQMNPFIKDKKYSFLDIIVWDWLGKGKSKSWALAEQDKIFEN